LLEPVSILLLSGLFTLLLLLVLFALWRGTAHLVAGIGHWALAFLAYIVCTVLFVMRDQWPDLLSIVLGNLIFLAGNLLLLEGLGRLKRQPIPHLFPLLLLIGNLLATLWFTYLDNSYAVRTLLFAAFAIVIYLYALGLLWRHRQTNRHLGEGLLAASLLLLIVTTLLRAVDTWMATEALSGLLSLTGNHALYLLNNVVAVVFVGLALVMLVHEQLRLELEHLVAHDTLTGVFSRAMILSILDKSLAGLKRGNSRLGVLMLDLDHFKQINDQFGHPTGDALLAGLARTLEAHLRQETYIGRIGGEEFLVVMPACSEGDLLQTAERLRRCAEEYTLIHANKLLRCTISIGGIEFHPHAAHSNHPLAEIDAALYEAKKRGRNCVVVR